MKKKIKIQKDKLLAQKRVYVILLILLAIGIFLGLLYPLFLSNENTSLLSTSITSFFNNVLNNQINYNVGIKNSLLTNSIFLISIWLFGISLIGLPIVLVLLIYKGFIFGFSVSSIIKVYGIKGIFGAFTYLFPGTILALITTILLCFYSTSFSIKLFRYLFLKENLNFKAIMNKYLKILGISFVLFILVTISDVYLAPVFMKVFTFLIK